MITVPSRRNKNYGAGDAVYVLLAVQKTDPIYPMQGQIIHYDALTRCGLLRNDVGELIYFRREQVVGNDAIADRQRVDLIESAGTVLTVLPISGPVASTQTSAPVGQNSSPTYDVVADWPNWLGGFTAVVTALVLWLVGRDITWASYQKTPSLTNSWWGIGAGSLLIYQAVNYVASVPARTLRSTAWVVVFCSVGFQGCNEFQTKTLLGWYDILLLATLTMAYVLPLFKRS